MAQSFHPHWDPNNIPDQTGKVAIVTGGNSGIGFETVYFLASVNATVYIAGRSEERATKAIESLNKRLAEKKKPTGNVKFHHLDISTINGAINSAKSFMEKESRLDILIANAGVSFEPWKKDVGDGYEPTFATNHLGHYSFITTLLPLLEKTGAETKDVRVVITSSNAVLLVKNIHYDWVENRPANADTGRKFSNIPQMFKVYANSKLANMWFGMELDRRLRQEDPEHAKGIWVNTAHPGAIAATNLGYGALDFAPQWFVTFAKNLLAFFALSTSEGASTQTYLATSPQIPEFNVHGRYWSPKLTWLLSFNRPQDEKLADLYYDPKPQQELWEWTEEAVKKHATS